MATPTNPEDSFPDRKWEDGLAFVAPKDGDLAKVTNRADVTKDPWFKSDHRAVSAADGDVGTPSGYDYGWSQGWTASGGKSYTYQIGFSLTPEVGDNGSDTPLSKFIHEPWAIIGPPLNTLIGNSTTSVGSFDDGAMMLRNVLNHMDFVENDIKAWVKDINVPDSEMQGTAAGAFKRVLVAVQQQVAYLHQEVVNRGDIPTLIDSARVKLHDAMFALVTAADTFRNAPGGWPGTHVHDTFFNAMAGATLTFSSDRGSVTLDVPGLGNPTTPEFWSTLEQKSKDAWLKQVADVLDTVAKPQLGYVQTAYQAAIDVIPPSALTKPPYRDPNAPKPPGDKKPPGDDTGDKKPPGDDTGDKKPPGDDTNTGDKPPGSGITGPPKTESNVPPPPPQSKTTGPPQTNEGGGGGNTLLDKNNQPIKDSKGNTPDIPPGSHIDPKTNQIIGPDGKPVLGADKKPLMAPANSHIGPGPSIGNSSSNSKTSQQQLKEQQELAEKQIKQQKANQQQQLKDQQELQEKQLKQQQLNQQQQLKQRKAQEAQEVEQEKAYQKALSGIRGDARTESSGNGYGNKTGGGGRNKLNLEELPPRGNERLPNGRSVGDPKTSVSERVRTRTSANEPNLAAEESAVRQSSAMNRTSSNGQPMMPPMGGGGGGGGGGERDRERRTWLAEDEETWGTSQAAAPGVIG